MRRHLDSAWRRGLCSLAWAIMIGIGLTATAAQPSALGSSLGEPASSAPAAAASQPAERTVRQPVHLLNGRNLDAFYTYLVSRGRDRDPKEVFTVRHGLLRVSGEELGCLTTHDEYENYVLVAEYKWGGKTWPPRTDKARDSGILVHSIGKDGGYSGIWMCSIEVQIIEGGTGDFIVVGDGTDRFAITATVGPKQGRENVFDPSGDPLTITKDRINWWGRDPAWKDVLGFRGRRDVERPLGEWNRLECRVEGGTIEVRLNGVLVNRCTNVQPTCGRIQIQSEGAEIFFRLIDLLSLDDPSVRLPREERANSGGAGSPP